MKSKWRNAGLSTILYRYYGNDRNSLKSEIEINTVNISVLEKRMKNQTLLRMLENTKAGQCWWCNYKNIYIKVWL